MPGRTFEQWVDCIFDHPVSKPAWYWADADNDTGVEPDTGEEPDELNVEYLTRLFTECDRVLRRFDDAQVNQGLDLIVGSGASTHAYTIISGTAPWPKRRACIRAIYDVYANCFAKRCSHDLFGGSNPLNDICYMWWDIFPAWTNPDDPASMREAEEYLKVMERCLTLSHDACLVGALHGLGHWFSQFPDRVEPIIDPFLRTRNDLSPELVVYARNARRGGVQ